MIIVWRWKPLRRQKFWSDEIQVKGQARDKVVRISESAADPQQIIYEKVEKYQDAELFIFLHRNKDHFDNKDVKKILAYIKQSGWAKDKVKCFLFSGGRDYIYYGTQNEGLLDQHGNFMVDRDYRIIENGVTRYEEVSVIEKNELLQEWEVLPKHFNKVWRYYQHEFKKKIFDLHIELQSFLTEISASNKNLESLPGNYWLEKLKERKLLLYRLRSFLDAYNKSELDRLEPGLKKRRTKELEKLKEQESVRGISYVFDDCTTNLEAVDGAQVPYLALKIELMPVFASNTTNTTPKISLERVYFLFEQLLMRLN